MPRFLQEFFWTPEELIAWLRKVSSELGLWVVVWPINEDASPVDPSDLRADMFAGLAEDAIHLFLGKTSHAPEWRVAAGSKRLLDFQRSYAVQLVPSVIAPDRNSLLQGRLAILRPDQYDETERTDELLALFKRLRSGMKQQSHARHRVVQRLPNGDRKVWRGILVGKSVPSETQLKQFANSEVVFEIAAGV